METVIERIGGINKVVVKHNHQAFILQCAEADVEYFKHCFDVMIDCFRKECEGKNEPTELSNWNKPAVSKSEGIEREAAVCETCRNGFWLRKNTKCLDCGRVCLE